MLVLTIALTLFLASNPIGSTPTLLTLVKHFDFQRQRIILIREAIISMVIAYFFLFLGEPFLDLLHVEPYAVTISGGVLLLVVALNMIFPHPRGEVDVQQSHEPFIVPIATPLLSGGGVFTAIIIYVKQGVHTATVALSILTAWIGVIFVVGSAAYLQKLLKQRGLLAMEQLMGMLLTMFSIEIIVSGLHQYINAIHTSHTM